MNLEKFKGKICMICLKKFKGGSEEI